MKDWVLIYQTGQAWEAEMQRGLLEDNGIECVLINKQDSAYLFGEVELYVKTDNAIQAKLLLTPQSDA